MNHQEEKKTTREIRFILIFASILVLSVGSSLYFFPGKTDLLFSWTINPPLTAAFLGGGYLAAFVLEYLASRESNWSNARIAVPGVWAFTSTTLFVTLYHIDRFHFDSPHLITVAGTWVWLMIYILVPLALGLSWLRQIRQPGVAPLRENKLPGWMRFLVLIQGLVLFLSGAAMVLFPEKSIPFWPWALSALTSRAIGAWGIGNGVLTIQAFFENDWRRLRAFMPSAGLYGVLQLINLGLFAEEVNWQHISTWIYLIFLISVLIVGGYGTLIARKKQ